MQACPSPRPRFFAMFIQLPRVPSLIPSSRAISTTDRPELITKSTTFGLVRIGKLPTFPAHNSISPGRRPYQLAGWLATEAGGVQREGRTRPHRQRPACGHAAPTPRNPSGDVTPPDP